jgi:threonine dehydrogenase-like Zn-dependent dehydrogenase
MFTHRIRTIASTVIGAAAIGLATIATASVASAGTVDENFIAQMNKVGVTFTSPAEAVNNGQKVCQALASGESGVDIANEVTGMTNLTNAQAAHFVINAATAYCPQFGTQVS